MGTIVELLAQEHHRYLALAFGVINHQLVAGSDLLATREKAARSLSCSSLLSPGQVMPMFTALVREQKGGSPMGH